MLRLQPEGPDLWDSILPEELRKLPDELARVDELLQNPRFMESFVMRFDEPMGRPGTPVAIYLRMMYLKFRYRIGYETLVEEVSDSISWRRFCGIGVQQSVPDSTTLIKLTHKYGERVLEELHDLLIEDLRKRKLVRGRKIRVDSTVVASDIHYPTDAGLLFDGLRRMRQGLLRLPKSGLRLGRTMKKAKKLIFSIAQALRKSDAKASERVRRINKALIRIARGAVKKVRGVLQSAPAGRTRERLATTLDLTQAVAEQSEQRLAGKAPPDRIVSLADPGARAIVKGKLDKPVEFGRTAQVTQDESGYFTRVSVHRGNPGDAPLVPTILETHQGQFGVSPKSAAFDMGYSSEDNHRYLKEQGVSKIGMPWRGKPPPAISLKQKRPWFKKLMAFRAGMEGSLSFLSRKFGLKRSMFRGDTGTMIWVSWVVLAANLYRFGRGGSL
jgi:transposase, IS5 family